MGSTAAALGAVIIVLAGVKDQLCLGNATVADSRKPLCIIQAYLYLGGCLLATASSCCQCCELYMNVVRHMSKHELFKVRRFYLPFVTFFTSYPLILVAATDSMGFSVRIYTGRMHCSAPCMN